MNYGHFSPDGREYIIDNVATPRPWINYIYNNEYFSTISANGGGISYHRIPLHGRITRYRINDVPADRPGKYIYIQDQDSGEMWSLTWQPVGKHLEKYRVAHGFGYTRVESEIEGIQSELLFFVPRTDNREIWKSVLTNKSDKKRHLKITGYVEFALGHALVDLINQCDDQHFNRVYLDKELNSIFGTKTYWVTETKGTQQQENKEWDQWAFFTVNHPIKKYETVREEFIGFYRNETNPIALETGNLRCKDTDFGNTVGAIQIEIELEPGEARDVVFQLGVIPKVEFEGERKKAKEKRKNKIQRFQDIQEVKDAFAEVRKYWDEYFAHTRVQTPDQDVNIFMNGWSPYQAKVAFDIGRVTSFYYWGIGRGFGFRDTAQDTIAVTISYPEKAKQRILMLARQMRGDGKVYHHFHGDGQGEYTKHCDDPLWFILAVTDYIKETGDFGLLDNVQPFNDGSSGTILDHLMSVVTFVKGNLGAHGLPVFGRGDWNDTLDYIGGDDGGESVWGGMFYVSMLNLLIELLARIDKPDLKSAVDEVSGKMTRSLDDNCWDGDWYIRAFGENQKRIGAKDNKYGKIFINTQTWAVLAGLDPKRQEQALESIRTHLDSEQGPKKCSPAYREIDPKIGLVTRCVWGKKENGAIFGHPTTWLIQAECMLGHGNEAFRYYKKMLPNRIDSDTFFAEPYVYSQYITCDEHETAGRASHSWQTGTAAWMYRVVFDYFFGARASYDGLIIDPTIPSDWKEFTMERVHRGTRYMIHVLNPDGKEKGVTRLIVEGVEIGKGVKDANYCIPLTDKEICQVEVQLG
ncbi:MAG TPA: glycosyl transferase family 36 [Bacteroidales bacterium]|nr:glycosyl transferase family 36 [Bacteroidales bacterium]